MRFFVILLVLVSLYNLGRYIYFKPAVSSGGKALNFSATDLYGKSFSLEQFKGKYILLDFWGSWCGPCRQENPAIVALAAKYKSLGLETVQIGIEYSEKSWLRAIEKDGLSAHTHILQEQAFDSPIAKLYGIREIPASFLLDPQGNIILSKPSISELEEHLNKIFKQ